MIVFVSMALHRAEGERANAKLGGDATKQRVSARESRRSTDRVGSVSRLGREEGGEYRLPVRLVGFRQPIEHAHEAFTPELREHGLEQGSSRICSNASREAWRVERRDVVQGDAERDDRRLDARIQLGSTSRLGQLAKQIELARIEPATSLRGDEIWHSVSFSA
ncbi:hypothetical protein [Methylosinus sp. PW1]|uniref:hypothetical protein n=1 Tax=Methylosinus sp. PW1 TaxID=107636 RepID=UPI0012ECADCC|nr:hypothetical protein [Methylosinus sp. PW1]